MAPLQGFIELGERKDGRMEKKAWAVVRPGKGLLPLLVVTERDGEKVARTVVKEVPGPCKIVLLAVKGWRKYRWRLYQKAVERMSRAGANRYDLKSRITPGAVVVLKELTV